MKRFPVRLPLLPLLLATGFALLFPFPSGAVSARLPVVPDDTLGQAEVWGVRRVPGVAEAAPFQEIDSLDFYRRGITSTADALRRLAGVNLRDYGGAGGLKTVSVRGLGAAHTAVTFDGLPVTDTQQGQIDLQQFRAERLGGISLTTLDAAPLLCPVRGLAAAVVSLRSQQPDTVRPGLHGAAWLRQAAFGTYNASLSLNGRVAGRTWAAAGGDWFRAANDYPFTVENGVATAHLRRTNSRMQTATAEAGTLTLLRGGRVETKFYFHHNHRRLPGMVRYYVNENNESLIDRTAFGQVRWQQRFGRMRAFAAAKWNWQESRYTDVGAQYPGGAWRENYRQHEAYLTAGAQWDAAEWLRLALSSDYARASLRSNLATQNRADRDTWLTALSLGLGRGRWQLTARGVAHLVNNHLRGGGAAHNLRRLTPSLTASWLALRGAAELRLRAGWKETFRPPTFTESYYYHLGSPTLRPELTRQFSAGATVQAAPARWWPLVALTVDGYYNKVKDRISAVPYSLHLWRMTNLGHVRATGLDATLSARFRPARRHLLSLSANYSLQSCRDRSDRTTQSYGAQLAYVPRHSGAASLSWENPWLPLVASLTASGARWCTNNHAEGTRLPAWTELGFGAWRSFPLKGRLRLTLRADLINALNCRYEVIGRYPMPGRSYRVAAGMDF